MVLIVPIGPLVWVLVWAFRALSGKKAVGTVSSPGFRLTASLGHVVLFIFVYLPLALTVTIFVSDTTRSEPLTWLAFIAMMLVLGPGPRWLAWRLLGPFGLAGLGRVCLWLAPFGLLETFRGNLAFFASAYGGKPGRESRTASWWLLFAAALDGEAQGSPRQTEQLLEMLDPATAGRLPWRLGSQGIELLAWPAIERGAWEEAGRRLAPGHGRGVRLLRRLAAIHGGQASPSAVLWLLWLRAPERRRTLPLVRSALKPAEPAPRPVERLGPRRIQATGEDDPFRRHLELLAAAAAGQPVRPARVQALADRWEAELGADAQLRLMVRGAELGVTDVQTVVAALPPSIASELEALAEAAEGPWPAPRRPESLAAQVRRRRLDRLFAAVQTEVEPFLGHDLKDFPRKLDAPLVEVERWLRFRRSLRRLLESEAEALPTAWHNGLRLAACNWPVYLLRTYGPDAHWACREMSRWCEGLARQVGDAEIAKLSHGNARIG
ncbi:MAG TPA: hypothetical protein VIA62_07560 [Thermoanaerobaculia bacterium]|nr:hypothetical protein [Thermoanaerobaculia bacterium]